MSASEGGGVFHRVSKATHKYSSVPNGIFLGLTGLAAAVTFYMKRVLNTDKGALGEASAAKCETELCKKRGQQLNIALGIFLLFFVLSLLAAVARYRGM